MWGSTGSLDTSRKTLYITTGNNYTVPDDVANCIRLASVGPAQRACLAPDNYVDAIVALDTTNGVVYGCSFAGTFTALNASSGAPLWKSDSGGTTCAAGASISNGTVFWGTGYNQIMFAPVAPSTVTAFSTP